MARKKKEEEIKLGIYTGTVDDIFTKLLEDPEMKKMKRNLRNPPKPRIRMKKIT